MPNVMGREFPYTAEGMAAAQQYSQAMGMRDGGMMGFRPVGYQGGGSVPVGYADGDVVMDEQDRVVLIEYLMDMTGMGPNTFLEMPNADLMRAREKVDADALKAETQQMPPPAAYQAPNFPVATGMGAMQDPAFAMAEDERAAGTPPRMNRGGIMSLRGY